MNIGKITRKAGFAGLAVLGLSACGGQGPAGSSAPAPATEAAAAEQPTPTADDKVNEVAGRIVWLRSANPYGHTGIRLETEGKVIYLDPADLQGAESMPKADVILVTHAHADHFSVPTIQALTKAGTIVVSIREVGYSLSGVEFLAMAPGNTADAGGLEVQAVPAYNADHPKGLGYLGFVFAVEGVRIYCTGDTDWIPEMESISAIEIAVVNLRSPYSLSGQDAVRVAETLAPKILIPIHWMPDNDSFGDRTELEYLRANIPEGTELMELELTP